MALTARGDTRAYNGKDKEKQNCEVDKSINRALKFGIAVLGIRLLKVGILNSSVIQPCPRGITFPGVLEINRAG